MGRLDDIVARNKAGRTKGFSGVPGIIVAELTDPRDSADDRKRKLIAMGIVLGLVAVVAVIVMMAT